MYYSRSGQPSSAERVLAAVTSLEARCRTLGLMDSDYGKAIVRIKVDGFDANLARLKLTAADGATWQEEVVALALASFKRAQSSVKSPDSDGDTYERRHVEAMERAVQTLC